MEAASSVQEKDKMADGSGFPSPLPCVVSNLLIFEGKRWVLSDKNCGKGTKILFLSEVISPILLPKKQEKLIDRVVSLLQKAPFYLSPVPLLVSVATVKEPGLKRISVPSFYMTKGRSVAFESS